VKSYILYIIEDAGDALTCANFGVFDFVVGKTECENCGMSIGPLDEVFVPCAVLYGSAALLDEEMWPICIDCIAPLIFPGMWIEGEI
jgi:hypothetical protein